MGHGQTLAIIAISASVIAAFTLVASAEEGLIPSWIKTTAGFWVDNQVSDTEFIGALQFLITNRIIEVPSQDSSQVKELQDEITQLKTENSILKSQLDSPSIQIQVSKTGFKEYSSKAYGFAFNIPDSWYENLRDENCSLFISEKPKGEGSSLCALTENKVPMEYGQELLDTIYEKKSDDCRLSENKALGYSCEGFTPHKLDQISMDGTPAYLISYSEKRWTTGSGTKITHTFWEIYIPFKYETTLFTLKTTKGDITEYDEIIDEIISSFKFVSKR